MTKKQLFAAFTAPQQDAVIEINGECGTLRSVQRESGNGHTFDVTLHMTSGPRKGFLHTFFVRTID